MFHALYYYDDEPEEVPYIESPGSEHEGKRVEGEFSDIVALEEGGEGV